MFINNYNWLIEATAKLPDELPAAMLLYGQRGIGKDQLGMALSQAALCADPQGIAFPCGQCDDCHLFEIDHHPDFRKLQPEQDSDEEEAAAHTKKGSGRTALRISVEAIRDLAGLLNIAPHRGKAKVVLISPVEALNANAANALLKMLEEPGISTHFILVTHDRNRLLATVRSRCFQFAVHTPSMEAGVDWLQQQGIRNPETSLCLSGYAPLAAEQLSKDDAFWTTRDELMRVLLEPGHDPLQIAAICEKVSPVVLGRLLSMYAFDLLALASGASLRYNLDLVADMVQKGRAINRKALWLWCDRISAFLKSAHHPLSQKLSLEALFIERPA